MPLLNSYKGISKNEGPKVRVYCQTCKRGHPRFQDLGLLTLVRPVIFSVVDALAGSVVVYVEQGPSQCTMKVDRQLLVAISAA